MSPAGTAEKTPFNVQPDGASAFSVNGSNFTQGSVVVANGQKLVTAFGSPEWISAELPPALFEKAGSITIKVTSADGKDSNGADFQVGTKQAAGKP